MVDMSEVFDTQIIHALGAFALRLHRGVVKTAHTT